jgi:hypothetical protein
MVDLTGLAGAPILQPVSATQACLHSHGIWYIPGALIPKLSFTSLTAFHVLGGGGSVVCGFYVVVCQHSSDPWPTESKGS